MDKHQSGTTLQIESACASYSAGMVLAKFRALDDEVCDEDRRKPARNRLTCTSAPPYLAAGQDSRKDVLIPPMEQSHQIM
jgi:hypothetical protein